jgi:hypothetical protein
MSLDPRLRSAPLRTVSVTALLLIVCAGCLGGTAHVDVVRAQDRVTTPETVDHTRFDRVLKEYVDDAGFVDYARLQAHADSVLRPYLQQLAETDPSALGREARLAFWINAYNAYTINLILDHYPVESINDIKPAAGPAVPKINSPFKLDVGEVAGEVRTLDEIEHGIIRERFDEPRIHFALVCAAVSCPRLRKEAYTGNRLDDQLDDQARAFLQDTDKNVVPADEKTVALSRIFKWFDEDFGGSPASIQRFIAPYFDGNVRTKLEQARYDVSFREYDWSLNDRARHAAGR